jgi:peptidoglycan/xylan/chitin deacetylase (PgdA/CDA1 family)
MTEKTGGYFVVSLDFELFWGMSDVTTIAEYGPNVAGERTAIPRMLDAFTKYGIHATWATVGMLMCRNKEELLALLPPPSKRPVYSDVRMSSYHHIEEDGVGQNEDDDPYHYGPSLVKLILETPNQELANHTFSHFYAVDGEKNDPAILARDLEAHRAIARTYGIETTSIVFPRNQVTDETLRVCAESGMTAYRGNEDHFLYRARRTGEQSLFIRGLRLLDHYINISGYHTYQVQKPETKIQNVTNVPSSRFFRPYLPILKFFEPLRIRRIKKAMTHAAKRDEVFHLWWHPHNFGIHQEQNFKNLTAILEHYKKLQERYGMQSASMNELAIVASARVA